MTRFAEDDAPRSFWPTMDPDRLAAWGAGLALIVMAAVVIAWTGMNIRLSTANARDPDTLCLRRGTPPVAHLVLLDATDPLARQNGARFAALMKRASDATPKNGRLTVATFGGDVGRPLAVRFDKCSPGATPGGDLLAEGPRRAERTYRRDFRDRLGQVGRDLSGFAASPASPIVEQVLRAANDPGLPWRGDERVLTLFTDGLQNTTAMSPYRGDQFELPPAPPGVLTGVTVNYVELVSSRDSARQTAAVRAAWMKWLTDAGATVKMYAPGYPPPD